MVVNDVNVVVNTKVIIACVTLTQLGMNVGVNVLQN